MRVESIHNAMVQLPVETDKLQLPGKQAAGELAMAEELAALRSEQAHLGATLIAEQGANAVLQVPPPDRSCKICMPRTRASALS